MSSSEPRVLVVDRAGELAARLRHHVLGARAVVKACPDAARAERHLAAARWDVVVAGPTLMHPAGLRRLSSLHERHPWVSVVLALHERPRADLSEIVQVGADDLVPLHSDDADLRRALLRAARLTRARLGGPGRTAGPGRIVMIGSASGGCGKTFLATNAAEFLARATDQPVVLVDLDLQFGEVSTALRLRPEVTVTDLLAAEAEGYDLDEILDDHLLSHPDGFKVLAAPSRPAEADSVSAGDVVRILDTLRARRAWVVIDTHEGLSDLFVAALDATDHVFAVSTPDRPSLVSLDRFLAVLGRHGMAAGSISVVVNKADSDMWVDAGRRFDAIVPYSREIPRSLNEGIPLLAGKPKSPISTVLADVLSAALPRRPNPEPTVVTPVSTTVLPAPLAEAPAPVDPDPLESAPGEPVRNGEEPTAVEIDLTVPSCRSRSATVRARQPGRCRRSTERAVGSPGRGRAPPPRCGPSGPRPNSATRPRH